MTATQKNGIIQSIIKYQRKIYMDSKKQERDIVYMLVELLGRSDALRIKEKFRKKTQTCKKESQSNYKYFHGKRTLHFKTCIISMQN